LDAITPIIDGARGGDATPSGVAQLVINSLHRVYGSCHQTTLPVEDMEEEAMEDLLQVELIIVVVIVTIM
jgi:hypothetical protein